MLENAKLQRWSCFPTGKHVPFPRNLPGGCDQLPGCMEGRLMLPTGSMHLATVLNLALSTQRRDEGTARSTLSHGFLQGCCPPTRLNNPAAVVSFCHEPAGKPRRSRYRTAPPERGADTGSGDLLRIEDRRWYAAGMTDSENPPCGSARVDSFQMISILFLTQPEKRFVRPDGSESACACLERTRRGWKIRRFATRCLSAEARRAAAESIRRTISRRGKR